MKLWISGSVGATAFTNAMKGLNLEKATHAALKEMGNLASIYEVGGIEITFPPIPPYCGPLGKVMMNSLSSAADIIAELMGLYRTSIHLPFGLMGSQISWELMKTAIGLSIEVEEKSWGQIERFVMHSSTIPLLTYLKRGDYSKASTLDSNVRNTITTCEDAGIPLAIENLGDRMGFPGFSHLFKLPYAGGCYDICHAFIHGDDIKKEIAEHGKRILEFHISDSLMTHGQRCNDTHCTFGRGNVPILEALDTIGSNAPNTPIVIEVQSGRSFEESINYLLINNITI